MQANKANLTEMNSWDDFFSYANSIEEKEKGNIFESLTKLILTTHPKYCSILKAVWIQSEGIPKDIREKINLPTTDEGIDLIAETFRGEYWAIQCKFKGKNQAPTYKEISTFTNLAYSHCQNISLAMLVHTGEKGVKKRALLPESYSELSLDFWLGMTSEDWARIHKKAKGKSVRPTLKAPRPHQQKAIEAATEHFLQNQASRGRLIMPCGTGKSLTAFWIATALDAKSVIIAVPSLSLIKQSLEDWTTEFVARNEDPRPQWLVICSDESTSKIDKDEFVSDAHSLGIPTTTNIDVIGSFLSDNTPGRKVIFTTYQSSEKLAQAARKCNFSFDLAILDEAHKTVGVKSKSFATLLLDKNISIFKRMFMTATERVLRGSSDEVFSMDDPQTYGDLFYQLSFKDAIHATPPIISDYKVLTITVTNDEIEQLIAKNRLITDEGKKVEEQQAQSLAAAIALRKATQTYGIKHAISFHRSIKGASDFTALNNKLNVSSLDNVLLSSSHISSKKSAGERARLMSDFTLKPLALMTNARCLTEGVDVPAIDCVLFADPKQSVIDIVQAAGRALRPNSGKEFGYIMLPLIVPDDTELEEFTKGTPFREVARIITALSTQDEGIAEEFRITGAGKQSKGGKILFDGTIPVGLKMNLHDFANEINSKIWERVAKVNWRTFQDAKEFIHKLKLNNQKEWQKYVKTKDRPHDIPVDPKRTYKGIGWKGYGDWLGTGTIANRDKEFLSYESAHAIVSIMGITSVKEWRKLYRLGVIPKDIPANPDTVYAISGWIGYGNWFGTGVIASQKRIIFPFDKARPFVHKLKFRKLNEWREYCKSGNKPDNIPANPDHTYKGKGWKGFGDWLGNGMVANQMKVYRSFQQSRAFVRTQNLKDFNGWREYCKSAKKPEDIPANPNKVYANEGWIGFNDWLGTEVSIYTMRSHRSFEESREFVRPLKLNDLKEWVKYCKSGEKPKDIPSNPHKRFKNQGWISYGDWLGTGAIADREKVYMPWDQAKIFVQELKLTSVVEWRKYSKSGFKPADIPADPKRTYKDKGWKGYGDWLGTRRIATNNRNYRLCEEAKIFVHNLGFRNQGEWRVYCKSGMRPDDIPACPNKVYAGRGWKGYADWLK